MDRELGALILGRPYHPGTLTCYEASKRVLREVEGWPRATSSAQTYYGADPYQPTSRYFLGDPQDTDGKFLTNGGCAYIDMGHPEICTPECRSATQYVASVQAMNAIIQDALLAANARMTDGQEIVLNVDNSDRQGNSYGAHLSITLSRTLWDDTFNHRLFPHLLFLASFQASSIVLTGGGKVGSEDGAPLVDYQLSRRSDFIKTFVAEQTTFNRPMVNARDESLGQEARLHVIFFDAVLLPAANYLQFGCLQLITAMMEAGAEWMDEGVLLERPIEALHRWSGDASLTTRTRLGDGRRITAMEHQEMLLDRVERFVAAGRCEDTIPGAARIVAYWRETLGFLQHGDEERASRRIEWLAKRRVLEAVMDANAGLDWQSLEIRHLDLSFGDLSPDRGVYWALENSGAVDQLVSADEVAHSKHHPPSDTRALARTTLLQQVGVDAVASVDWAEVRLRRHGRIYKVPLPSPDQSVVMLNDLNTEYLLTSPPRFLMKDQ